MPSLKSFWAFACLFKQHRASPFSLKWCGESAQRQVRRKACLEILHLQDQKVQIYESRCAFEWWRLFWPWLWNRAGRRAGERQEQSGEDEVIFRGTLSDVLFPSLTGFVYGRELASRISVAWWVRHLEKKKKANLLCMALSRRGEGEEKGRNITVLPKGWG